MIYIAYIFGFIAAIITFISTQVKEKKMLLITYVLSYFFFALNFLLVGATSGGITCLIAAAQILIISNNKNIKIKAIILISITVLMGIITYKNLISFIPTICNLIYIIIITNEKMKKIRKMMLVSRTLWCIYDFLTGAYLVFLTDFISGLGIIFAIGKYDIQTEGGDIMEDFLFKGLPVVVHEGKYIIFSYYNGKIVAIDEKEFDEEKMTKFLEEQNMLGTPKKCPGDYNDYVELVISLTNDCNLRCKYCFVGEKKFCKKVISKEDINQALITVGELAKTKNKKEVFITFFGGEPTLYPDLIEYSMEKAKEILKDYKVSFGITSNGVFNEKIKDMLVENNFTVTISMDGLPKFQDKQRVTASNAGTSYIIEKTIKDLVSKGLPPIIRMTITRPMIFEFKETIDYLSDLGVKIIHFEPMTIGGRAKENEDILERPEPEEYAEKLSEAVDYARKKDVSIISSTVMNALSPSYMFCDGVGKNKLAVTYDGVFSSCLGVQNKEHPLASKFIIEDTNIENWLNAKFDSYVDDKAKNTKCENCFAKYVCAGGCPSRNFNSTGDFEKIDDMQCIPTKVLLRKYIIDLYENSV